MHNDIGSFAVPKMHFFDQYIESNTCAQKVLALKLECWRERLGPLDTNRAGGALFPSSIFPPH